MSLNPNTHSCWTCGYTWKHGEHGGHTCSDLLNVRIKELESQTMQSFVDRLKEEFGAKNIKITLDNRDDWWDELQWEGDNIREGYTKLYGHPTMELQDLDSVVVHWNRVKGKSDERD